MEETKIGAEDNDNVKWGKLIEKLLYIQINWENKIKNWLRIRVWTLERGGEEDDITSFHTSQIAIVIN